MLKKSPQYEQLKEAMELIHELKIPDHLQEKALGHLLQGVQPKPAAPATVNEVGGQGHGTGDTDSLRDFVAKWPPKGAVEEIPVLLYWARQNENVDDANETDIVTLYRRSGLRPPKHVAQSMRDLSSKKKYGRLDAVKGKTGYVALSRTGEDFVIHDLIKRKPS
jgi:hypothetical protein